MPALRTFNRGAYESHQSRSEPVASALCFCIVRALGGAMPLVASLTPNECALKPKLASGFTFPFEGDAAPGLGDPIVAFKQDGPPATGDSTIIDNAGDGRARLAAVFGLEARLGGIARASPCLRRRVHPRSPLRRAALFEVLEGEGYERAASRGEGVCVLF